MSFPDDARVVDLAIVGDQTSLFDTLVNPSPRMRIVDVAHFSLTKFFQLMQDTDFVSEARSCGVEPAIFYIPDDKADSFEGGAVLRDNFPSCPFILVKNAFFQKPKHKIRHTPAFKTLAAYKWRFAMPRLAEKVVDALEDEGLSLSNFMRQPMSSTGESPAPDGLSPELRIVLRARVFKVFQEIHRVMAALVTHGEPTPEIASRHGMQTWKIGEKIGNNPARTWNPGGRTEWGTRPPIVGV